MCSGRFRYTNKIVVNPPDPSPTPWNWNTWGFYCDTCQYFFSLLDNGLVVTNEDCTFGYQHKTCGQPARYIGYDHDAARK